MKRGAFKEKFVKNLGDGDFRVCVVGTVTGVKEGGFFLVDGTGEVGVNSANFEGETVVKEGMFARVFGSLMPFEEGHELQAEIIQNFESVDKEALNKIQEKLV